ncbi:MAG: hypothetical protein NTX53_04105 [candidate division WOR-3 bacterium]|nr:hypothetical protein [candidate division WOR-3 bacterium]
MKYITLSVVLLAALAAGNPFILSIINEFGFDEDGLGWMELHPLAPGDPEMDMTGWVLTTNTSACTFAYFMPDFGFLVVDSASLAGGEYGHGTFRLDPAGDTIRMVADQRHPWYTESVAYPVLPAGEGRAPLPPVHGSASLAGVYGGWTPIYNWYIDSTPTPNQENDNYSTISGIVRWGSEHRFDWVDISVFGPMGSSFSNVSVSGEAFEAPGLGAGRYQVAACGWGWGDSLFYPESVDIGYSETLSGIILDFDAQGLEESRESSAYSSRPAATVMRSLPAGAVAFDATGRRVVNPRPGVYFVRSEPSAVSRQPSAVTVRKVVLQR